MRALGVRMTAVYSYGRPRHQRHERSDKFVFLRIVSADREHRLRYGHERSVIAFPLLRKVVIETDSQNHCRAALDRRAGMWQPLPVFGPRDAGVQRWLAAKFIKSIIFGDAVAYDYETAPSHLRCL